MKIEQSICIIGLGIRGIGVLERIIAYSKLQKLNDERKVYLIEKSDNAPLQYDIEQPDYLLLNIVCGQVSVFPSSLSVSNCPPINGPSLYDWVRQRKLLISNDGFTIGRKGRKIKSDDFLPRRILGEYLKWAQNFIEKQAPPNLKIIKFQKEAVNLSLFKHGLKIVLCNDIEIYSNFLFITVGQNLYASKTSSKLNKKINNPYPLPNQLNEVKSTNSVAIQGLGLTFYDALLSFTIGRGGNFKFNDGKLTYIPSGNEPTIFAFSTSGLLYRSRPKLGAPLSYKPLVFNKDNISHFLDNRNYQIDFDKDILPLIFLEMRIAYKRAKFCRDNGWQKSDVILGKLKTALKNNNIENELCCMQEFNPQEIFFESLKRDSPKNKEILYSTVSYQNWVKDWFQFDLKESTIGTVNSPFKSALEILREFRETIRNAVDFGKLNEKSHNDFFNIHSQTLNRIGVGPQKERISEVLALMDLGILQIPFGPEPNISWDKQKKKWKITSTQFNKEFNMFCDWLYYGHLSNDNNFANSSLLINSMYNKGIIKEYRTNTLNSLTIDVDEKYHPISMHGIANKKIWIMGLLNEGVTFYNGYVTSPNKFIRSQYDADIAIKEIFSN